MLNHSQNLSYQKKTFSYLKKEHINSPESHKSSVLKSLFHTLGMLGISIHEPLKLLISKTISIPVYQQSQPDLSLFNMSLAIDRT
jgi:hypothetical protein